MKFIVTRVLIANNSCINRRQYNSLCYGIGIWSRYFQETEEHAVMEETFHMQSVPELYNED
jgi:hypothetical protein